MRQRAAGDTSRTIVYDGEDDCYVKAVCCVPQLGYVVVLTDRHDIPIGRSSCDPVANVRRAIRKCRSPNRAQLDRERTPTSRWFRLATTR